MSDSMTDMERQVLARKRNEELKKELPSTIKSPSEIAIEIPDDDIQGYINENRVGDAKLYCRLFRDQIVYVRGWERFLIWQGHHWAEDQYNYTYQCILQVCEVYQNYADRKTAAAYELEDKEDRKKALAMADVIQRRANALRDIPGQDKLLVMVARIQNPLIILPDVLDKNHYVKACPNGVIDLRTGEMHDGRPEEYLLNSIVTHYNPELLKLNDPCPCTNKFLLASMDGDQELVNFLWLLLGYGLITERRDHIFTIFWGEHGRNGKDTLIKLVSKVMGDTLSGDVPIEMFLQLQQTRSSSAPAPDILALRGMCYAWINEAEEGQRFALARLKKLTGGGKISARGSYDKQGTTWLQTHLPIMTTNELPKAKADDNAFWQRALLVKWPLSFIERPEQPYERKADKHLDDKVQAEAEGVLARMVLGAMEYLRDGLKIPDKVRQWTSEQRDKWDDAGTFIKEWCERQETQENINHYTWRISATELHDAFCVWYAMNRDKRFSISAKKFADMLNRKNIPFKRSNGSWRLGIRLNAEALSYMEDYRASKER